MTHIFGSHTVDNGGLDMAVRRAANAGLSALQCFSAIPKFYGDRSTIKPQRVERFHAALEETGMSAGHVVVHAAYVLNCATGDAEKWSRAAAGLAKEMERSNLLGVGGVCFHPGSATEGDPAEAPVRVARAMTEALRSGTGPTRLFVENTAGAGRTYGRTAAEVAAILSSLPDDIRQRAGYGLDTCHLFSSGYPIHESESRLHAILDEFEEATGEGPSFIHLNDSHGEFGSNRDRHVLLGDGRIGVEPFRWLLKDPRTHGIPLILETPQVDYEVADDDPTPDVNDLAMRELLHSLAG